jgi:hypothetical protein
MEEVRYHHYYHPVFGSMIKKFEGNYYNYDGNLYIPNGIELESLYERDRRLWVEQAMLKELVETDGLLNSSQVEKTTQYFCEAYDVIQKTISNFQTNK